MFTAIADAGNTPFSIMPPVTAPSYVLHYLQQDVSELIKLERLRSISNVAQMSLDFTRTILKLKCVLSRANHILPHRLSPSWTVLGR